MSSSVVTVIYDGDCPVCSNITLNRSLRARGYELKTINARDLEKAQLLAYEERGLKLDDGMLVIVGQTEYYGHEGLLKLLQITQHKNALVRLGEKAYSFLNLRALYRVLVRLRLFLLWVLGIKRL